MICLDNGAVISAFQLSPRPEAALYRSRVRAFILNHGDRFMIPTVVLAEYLFKFDVEARAREFQELADRYVHIAPFDRLTAEIAADLGRRFTEGRTLGSVARERGSDRYCLKADLMIIATAVQYRAHHFLTGDNQAHAVAQFAGLTSHLLTDLPEPPPPTRQLPTSLPKPATPQSLFPQTTDEDESENDEAAD